jgi:hypothetical protein
MCGLGHEYQPWLQPDGWLLVPIIGEAALCLVT